MIWIYNNYSLIKALNLTKLNIFLTIIAKLELLGMCYERT